MRCIKPNDEKSGELFDQTRVKHQIAYLGLLENVRVRRAGISHSIWSFFDIFWKGFCHRASYDRFVQRYKIIDSVRSKLHPHGPFTKESAIYICQELNIDKDVVYGNTKLFIKQP